MFAIVQTLQSETDEARALDEILKTDLNAGDRVLVTTRNSVYTIWTLDDGSYWVWGGWFDRTGESPRRVTINGCTWGGSAIKQDVVAARGLRLEFGNSVRTTRIRDVRVIRAEIKKPCIN